MKETTGHDISVGGTDLASQAMAAGLVDEMHLFLTPVTVGVVHLQYRTSS
jgi:dihydrofolate reductase